VNKKIIVIIFILIFSLIIIGYLCFESSKATIIDECEIKKTIESKSLCYSIKSLEQLDPTICSPHPEAILPPCGRLTIAVLKNDKSLCEKDEFCTRKFNEVNNLKKCYERYSKSYCLKEAAMLSGKVELCNQIEIIQPADETNKAMCYDLTARINRNPDLCLNIETEISKNRCLLIVSSFDEEKQLCHLLPENGQESKNNCLSRLAIYSGNLTYCNELPEELKNNCLNSFN